MTRPLVLQNLRIVDPSRKLDEIGAIIVGDDGRILAAGKDAQNQGVPADAFVKDCAGLTAVPGLVDARVFVGEPGSEHRETIDSASRAAATGGVTVGGGDWASRLLDIAYLVALTALGLALAARRMGKLLTK